MESNMKALVILSGGQDSATCLFWALKKYGHGNVSAIGFNYNQRHVDELNYAQAMCEPIHVPFEVLHLPVLAEITNNALTNTAMDVDTAKPAATPPNTYVEGRNILFLTYGAIYAKTNGMQVLVAGVSEADFSGYPDCRDTFIKACNVSLNLGMDYPFVIETPLMWRNKAQVWALAHELGVLDTIKAQTLTCYNGIVGDGCGNCPACQLRANGYKQFLAQK